MIKNVSDTPSIASQIQFSNPIPIIDCRWRSFANIMSLYLFDWGALRLSWAVSMYKFDGTVLKLVPLQHKAE